MTDHIKKTIADAMQQVQKLEAQIDKNKEGLHANCAMVNLPGAYEDITQPSVTKALNVVQRHDEFFNMPFSGAVRLILERRKTQNLGAADPDEIYDALV